MAGTGREDITTLLGKLKTGDESAKAELFELVYTELQEIAAALMRDERSDHTLQPTALVNEAALRLMGREPLSKLKNRRHFYGAAAQAMRRILVDHARAHNARKRGGDLVRVPLSDQQAAEEVPPIEDEVWLDDALGRLERANPRVAEVVLLRRYGGLANKEIADLLGRSLRSVEADFTAAKSWLYGEIKRNPCG